MSPRNVRKCLNRKTEKPDLLSTTALEKDTITVHAGKCDQAGVVLVSRCVHVVLWRRARFSAGGNVKDRSQTMFDPSR